METAPQIDAWGNVFSGSAAGNRCDYIGGLVYWRDADLRFSCVLAQWLDSETGRWLLADPMVDERVWTG